MRKFRIISKKLLTRLPAYGKFISLRIPLCIRIWGYSSAGRALEWHSRGQRFDPAYLHQTRPIRTTRPWSSSSVPCSCCQCRFRQNSNNPHQTDTVSRGVSFLFRLSEKLFKNSNDKAEYLIKQLFKAFVTHPKQLPDYVLKRYAKLKNVQFDRLSMDDLQMRYDSAFVRTVCDHIAGMTDQFASREYKRLYIPDIVIHSSNPV